MRDFFEFTQVAAAGWAATLRDILKAAGGDVLVTLGQDEGGTGTRPAQRCTPTRVDYTAVHTWWNNDDLLWDGVMTKAPEQPNMHQETGLMSLQDPDGAPWRTPAAAAASSTASSPTPSPGAAPASSSGPGTSTPTMPIDNEATIGLNRPDGTAKPEMDAVARLRGLLRGRPRRTSTTSRPSRSPSWSRTRGSSRAGPGGIDHTKRLVRLLAERHGVVPKALPDIRLTAEQLRGVKLAIVPSPEMLDEDAARGAPRGSKAGTKVLVTGAVEGDRYGRATPSLAGARGRGAGRPVALHETTRVGRAPASASRSRASRSTGCGGRRRPRRPRSPAPSGTSRCRSSSRARRSRSTRSWRRR